MRRADAEQQPPDGRLDVAERVAVDRLVVRETVDNVVDARQVAEHDRRPAGRRKASDVPCDVELEARKHIDRIVRADANVHEQLGAPAGVRADAVEREAAVVQKDVDVAARRAGVANRHFYGSVRQDARRRRRSQLTICRLRAKEQLQRQQ